MGCSSVWVTHAILSQNHIKWTWVALHHGLLKLFWVKPIQKGCGLLFIVGCSCHFGSNQYKWTWVALQCGLLMPFWVQPIQMDMGCSLVWVAHAILGPICTNEHGLLFSVGYSCNLGSNQLKWTWVALQCGLLIQFWVKPVQMDMGCSSVWVAHAILGYT